MASEVPMQAPICLVENNSGELVVNQKALQILTSITKPVVVVAIVGLYRTGKSYLLNRLAGRNKGFSLGSTIQSHTKGIWMWCIDHPTEPDHTLVLLDTEGLGDVEKGDSKNDSWIFALAILLSSTFVYNSMNTINHQALEEMQYPFRISEYLNSWSYTIFITPLSQACALPPSLFSFPSGKNPSGQWANLPRECIRNFFPNRNCFTFDRPTYDKSLLSHLEDVHDSQLDPLFKHQADQFCFHIFSNAKPKTLSGGIKINGNRLGNLLETYVETISSGDIPCLENAVLALAETENSAAVQKATKHYVEQMVLKVDFPTETLQDLLNLHTDCEKESISIFMKDSFKDDTHKFQNELVEILENKKNEFIYENEEKSIKYCQSKLSYLSESLREAISQGTFSVPGGYSLFRNEKEKILNNYDKVLRKGIKAGEVLQKFVEEMAVIEESILKADEALTDQEKALEAEQIKREATKKEQKLLEQQQMEIMQKMEAQKRSYEENMKQLKIKLEAERDQIMREQKMILNHKLKEQKNLMVEGFHDQAVEMEKQIDELQANINNTRSQKSSWLPPILDSVGTGLMVILPGAGKLLGLGIKGLGHAMS
uniref:GB1/RHD3-type G domain-containing protein n=1 Tax=Monodelphis domestica TaxID=13616 RepID=K7E431_MONDO